MRLLDKAFWAYKRERPIRGRRHGRRLLTRTLPAGRTAVTDPAETGPQVRLLLVGDIMPLRPFSTVEPTVELSASLIELFHPDILMANLEGPVGDHFSESQPSAGLIGTAPRLVMTPTELGMHRAYLSGKTVVLSTANNHAWDLGLPGIRRTLRELDLVDTLPVGTSYNIASASDHYILPAAGLTIGIVPFTFGTNGLGQSPTDRDLVNVAPLNEQTNPDAANRVIDAIRACQRSHCDLIVVSLHWGLEFEWFPVPHQVRIAHRLVDAGADVVWGHHPHIVQPVELYPRNGTDQLGVIIYSAGNLITPILSSHSRLSLAIELTVGLADDHAILCAVDIVPMVFSITSRPGSYRLDRLDTLQPTETTELALAEIHEVLN